MRRTQFGIIAMFIAFSALSKGAYCHDLSATSETLPFLEMVSKALETKDNTQKAQLLENCVAIAERTPVVQNQLGKTLTDLGASYEKLKQPLKAERAYNRAFVWFRTNEKQLDSRALVDWLDCIALYQSLLMSQFRTKHADALVPTERYVRAKADPRLVRTFSSTSHIVFAKKDIAKGIRLTADDLEERGILLTELPLNSIQSASLVIGRVSVRKLVRGSMVGLHNTER